jgi:VWFA-related protein
LSASRRRAAALSAAATAALWWASALTTPSAAAPPQTFRSSANIVAVEATVVDRDGVPVTGLTAADFRIDEDGKSQPVATLYLVTLPGAANGLRATTGSDAPATEGAAPLEVRTRDRVMVFVLDLAHLSADGYKRGVEAIRRFLTEDALPSDAVGIVAGGVMLNNRIDTNKAALAAAMSSIPGPNQQRFNDYRTWPRLIDESEALTIARGNREAVDNAVRRACGEQPAECTGRGGDEVVRQQVQSKAAQLATAALRDSQNSLNALAALANGLGRLPGRKQVVVMSEGFITTELESQLKRVVQLAAESNVRISTLDARGLGRDPRSQANMGAQPLTTPGDTTILSADNGSDALSSLAIDTGGEFLMNRNDLSGALDIVARNAGTYYVLGYSTDKPMDGKTHQIDVKVNRPGLRVYARKAYIAISAKNEPSSVRSEPETVRPEPPTVRPEPSTVLPEPSTVRREPSSVPLEPPTVRPEPPTALASARVEALTRVSPVEPGAASSLADLGWAAYSKGDVAGAREKLSAAVAAGGTAPWVSYALGFSEFALGHYDAAAAAWESVRARVPQFLPVYFDLADAALNSGRGADAIGLLREAVRRFPADAEPRNALGTLLVRRGALDEAVDVFTAVTTAHPDDSLGFFNLGRAHHLRYLQLQRHVAASRIRGATAIGDDDRKKAIAAYKTYLTLGGPFEADAKQAVAILDWKEHKPELRAFR